MFPGLLSPPSASSSSSEILPEVSDSPSLTSRPFENKEEMEIKSVSLAQGLLDQLASNDSQLTALDLSGRGLTVTQLKELIKALEGNTHLNILNVSNNPIGDIGAQLLAAPHFHFNVLYASGCNISAVRPLAENTRLLELDLASNEISAAGAGLFAENKTLQSLSLAGNPVGDEGAISLSKNCTLISLTLSHCKIGIKGSQALAKNTHLKTLILSNNQIQSEGAMAFAENACLESLSIGGNNIETPGLIALSHNTQLTGLDVNYNEVSDPSAIALAGHPALTYLNLGYNQITRRGAEALAENTRLRSLILSYNLLGDEGVMALAQHKTLQHLDIAGNRIGFQGAYALSRNKVLTSLTLSSNLVGDTGGVILAQNSTLTELYLSYNGIGDSAALAFSDNTTLRVLNLNYNKVGEAGRRSLAKNKTLTRLTLSAEQPPEFTEENLDTIFLLSESFLCISSTKGILQFFNPAFSRVLGYNNDELLAKNAVDFLHPVDKEILVKQAEEKEEEKRIIHSCENHYRCKDNSFRTIRWTSHIKHHRQYAVGTDITDQRQIEKEFLLAQQVDISRRLQEAADYSVRQTEFIAQLSHEIRNPLSGIFGLVETLQEQIKQLEMLIKELHSVTTPLLANKFIASFLLIQESFRDMISCAEYQKSILDDNLDIARIAEKKLVLEKNPFELKKVLKQVISMLQAKASHKGVSLNLIAPIERECWVKGDPSRLKQILINLVGNAIKFTATGSIQLVLTLQEVTTDQTVVKIDVIDTGIGLSIEAQSLLFERFSQTSSSVGAHYGGSGLGLYLALQIARAMGGDITVKSELKKGSTFSVIVPFGTLSLHETPEVQTSATAVAYPSIPIKSFVNRTILVVDDNIINQKILTRILKEAGYQCCLANDGIEALSAYDKTSFDLILMDILMPNMDGLTATTEIRKKERENGLPRTPIFAITANALECDRAAGLTAGIDAYITKPFKKTDILKKIAALEERESKVVPSPSGSLATVTSPLPSMADQILKEGSSPIFKLPAPPFFPAALATPAEAIVSPSAIIPGTPEEKTEDALVNDVLNRFFSIASKAKGKQVWVATEDSPDTWELRGLLIPLTGKKYFSCKLTKIGLMEGTDFKFIERPSSLWMLHILNVKHLLRAEERLMPIAGRALLQKNIFS
ncbi:MAG: hypothetical protein K0R24_1523 [Gammaproteobacteria bacterium]|jgi:PAS domain S-box-containing protein|nr:hypothetical protein [Gammaproteobacteria bacterium]